MHIPNTPLMYDGYTVELGNVVIPCSSRAHADWIAIMNEGSFIKHGKATVAYSIEFLGKTQLVKIQRDNPLEGKTYD